MLTSTCGHILKIFVILYLCSHVRMVYIEENLQLLREQQRAGSTRESGTNEHPGSEKDGTDGMVKFGDKYKTTGKEVKEGSVTTSLAMLSGIPEVDLGMEYVSCFILKTSDQLRIAHACEIFKRLRKPSELRPKRNHRVLDNQLAQWVQARTLDRIMTRHDWRLQDVSRDGNSHLNPTDHWILSL